MDRGRSISTRPIEGAAVITLIVSILGLMMAPIVRHARAVSPMTICAAHLREIGVAFQTYREDWDDSYPMNHFCKTAGFCPDVAYGLEGSPYNWKRALLTTGSLKNASSLQCPSNPRAWAKSVMNNCIGDESNCVGIGGVVNKLKLPNSYGYNAAFFHEFNGIKTQADIESPSSMLVVVESAGGYPDIGDWATATIFLHPNHRANWLFADGKIRALKVLETISPKYLWRNPSDTTRSVTPNSLDRRLR